MSSSDPKSTGPAAGEDDLEAARLARWLREGEPDAQPPPELSGLFRELSAEVSAEHGPRAWLRSRATPMRMLIAIGALLAPALLTLLVWARPDIEEYPLARMIAVAGFLVAALVAAVLVALRPLHRPALPSWMAPAAVSVAIAGLVALYAMPMPHGAEHAVSAAPTSVAALFARAWPCLSIGLAVAFAVLSLLIALDRGGLRRAFVLAAAAGLGSNLVLQFHCPNTASAHLLVGHFGVLALLLLAAALVGRGSRPGRN